MFLVTAPGVFLRLHYPIITIKKIIQVMLSYAPVAMLALPKSWWQRLTRDTSLFQPLAYYPDIPTEIASGLGEVEPTMAGLYVHTLCMISLTHDFSRGRMQI